MNGTDQFGVLGKLIGDKMIEIGKKVPYIVGLSNASVEELKSFCASVATYGGTALFHIERITPEWNEYPKPSEFRIEINKEDILKTRSELIDDVSEIDFISIGCPHATINEIATIAALLRGKKVKNNAERN